MLLDRSVRLLEGPEEHDVSGHADQDCTQHVRRIRRVEEGRQNCGAYAAKDDVD